MALAWGSPHFSECTRIVKPGAIIEKTVSFDDHWYRFSFDLAFHPKSPEKLKNAADELDIQNKRGDQPQPGANTADFRTGFNFPVNLRVASLNGGTQDIIYDKNWNRLMYLGGGEDIFMTIDRIRLDPGLYKVQLTFLDGAQLPESSDELCFNIELPGKH